MSKFKPFFTPEAAFEEIDRIYEANVKKIREAFLKLVRESGELLESDDGPRRELLDLTVAQVKDATYPIVAIRPYFQQLPLDTLLAIARKETPAGLNGIRETRLSSVFYASTVTKPSQAPFADLLLTELRDLQYGLEVEDFVVSDLEQYRERLANIEDVRLPRPIYVGHSDEPIPLAFALPGSVISDETEAAVGAVYEKLAASGKAQDPGLRRRIHGRISRDIQECFARPLLIDIDDRVVGGHSKRDPISRARYRLYPSLFEEERARAGGQEEWHFAKPEQLNDAQSKAVDDDTKALKTQRPEDARALTFYSALRTDYSLSRIEHYLHTPSSAVQPYIIFTNYELYVRAFVATFLVSAAKGEGTLTVAGRTSDGTYGQRFDREGAAREIEKLSTGDYADDEDALIDHLIDRMNAEPALLRKGGQMPGYHFASTSDAPSISLVNIGVGPANARTITDNLAVLRPRVWMMLGHCAGVRTTQRVGEYVLPAGYYRRDHALEKEVPLRIDLPYVEVVNHALETAVRSIKEPPDAPVEQRPGTANTRGYLRSGVCMTTQNRHWELEPYDKVVFELEQARVIAVDMESATIAANGYRHRVPFGALLCISDNPLLGELKMRDMSQSFYEKSSGEHFRIGLEAIRMLDAQANRRELRKTRRLNGLADPLVR
ncbi:MAG: AMP nucleosidase [Pseudomonadota bacterium]